MQNFNFEEALLKLEKIVSELDNDACSLDKAVSLFEEGTDLCNKCYKTLKNAKLKIEKLETSEER